MNRAVTLSSSRQQRLDLGVQRRVRSRLARLSRVRRSNSNTLKLLLEPLDLVAHRGRSDAELLGRSLEAKPARAPVRDQIANATGDDATTPQAAAAKVKMLMERLKAGASFRDLATGYSEDPETAPRGGDLGFLPVSRLQQAPPALRDAVLNKAPGSVNVAGANGAYTLVLVVAHEQAGQRDLSTPGVRERITETLRGRKDSCCATAYLTTARGDATVVNHLARRLVAEQGKVPGLLPARPRSGGLETGPRT